MKSLTTTLIVTILFSSLSYAQVGNESFEQAVNFLNCEAVELGINKSIKYLNSDIDERRLAEQDSDSWFSGITSQSVAMSFLISLLFSSVLYLLISKYVKKYVASKLYYAIQRRGTSNNQSSLSLEIRDANNRIRDLESHIKNLNDKVAQLSIKVISIPEEKNVLQEVKQVDQKLDAFFLSTPNKEGSFNESSATASYKEGATIYKFTRKGNNKATFEIDGRDASVQLALQYPDKSIDPVCEAINAFNPKATRIITVTAGEALLQGTKWTINTKAKIRYEN
jgi:hypothetical protein